jgi:DNA-binding winged helix-turn-helix (wHTH) protein
MAAELSLLVRFDEFELDLSAGELRQRGKAVALSPQQFTLLAALVQSPGALVTRDELRDRLWGNDEHVEFDAGINFCIRQLRIALGDSAAHARFIQTVPRRGYRFIAPVAEPDGDPAAVAVPRPWQVRWLAAAALITIVGAAFGSYLTVSAAPALTPEQRIADAHAALGFVELNDKWAWADAERAFSRALQLDPRHEVALISLSRLHAGHGRFDEALAFAQRAVDAHPDSPRARGMLGLVHLFRGDAAAARTACHTALGQSPTSKTARLCLLEANTELGNVQTGTWARLSAQLQTSAGQPPHFLRATAQARLGHAGQALDELTRALAAREPDAGFALVHPALAALRMDPEFRRVTAAAGLNPTP